MANFNGHNRSSLVQVNMWAGSGWGNKKRTPFHFDHEIEGLKLGKTAVASKQRLQNQW
jgi:hypothetical protein